MKPLTLKIGLVVFFSVCLLNAFGQARRQQPAKKPVAAKRDTLLKHKTDSLSDELTSLKKAINATKNKADTLNTKADKLSMSLKKTDSTVASGKKADSTGMSKYRGKSFVFQRPIRVMETNAVGEIIAKSRQPIAPKGTTFTVEGITKNGGLIISFWIWTLNEPLSKNLDSFEEGSPDSAGKAKLMQALIDSANTKAKQETLAEQLDVVAKRKSFNFKKYTGLQYVPVSRDTVNDNRRYFTIGKDTLTQYCEEYKKVKTWNINYGALATTFKLRFRRFSFSDNLSLGGAIYYQRKMKRDTAWTWGFIGALSLSSVTLDSSTTNLHTKPLLTTSTSRPAFSPSVHYAITYKNIDLTVGIGWDLLSKPTSAATATATNPEAGWIYNNKPWLGIGIGFNLFSTSTAKGTPNDTSQSVTGK